jgi:hypothetical protein
MNSKFLTITALIFAIFINCLVAADTPNAQELIATTFFQHLKDGKKDEALKLMKVFPEKSPKEIESNMDEWIKSAQRRKSPSKVITSKVSTTVAVLVVNEKPDSGLSLDPIYLIKEGDKWKITINTNLDGSEVVVSDTVKAEYKELSIWYDTQEKELRAKYRESKTPKAK